MVNFPYSYPQAISKSHKILNKTGNSESPPSPGTVSFWFRKQGSRSKHIFAKLIKNSPRLENWLSNNLDTVNQILLKTLWAVIPRNYNTNQTWWTATHLNILRHQSQQELQIFYNKFSLRIKNWCDLFPTNMGKVSGRTPTGLLLLSLGLANSHIFW